MTRAAARPAQDVLMYDAVEPAGLPTETTLAAGYVGGSWPSYEGIRARFPRALVLSIAVNHSETAMVLDVERGDATPELAPSWYRMMQERGMLRPAFYTSVSGVADLTHALLAAGHDRSSWRLWTAHYTGRAHFCGAACGYPLSEAPGATQFDSGSRSRRYDVSLTSHGWVAAVINDYHREQR